MEAAGVAVNGGQQATVAAEPQASPASSAPGQSVEQVAESAESGAAKPETISAFSRESAQGAKSGSADEIDQRIAAAEQSGVNLSDADKTAIRETLEKAANLNRKASRTSALGSDPLNKGNAFPMGVGFTRETKRSNQRIDASVRRAGEAVVLWKKAEQAEKYAEALLAGKNTEADKLRKAIKREEMQRALVEKLEGWAKDDKIGGFTIERVNKDRDGYPASYTISGEGIVKGVQDKVDVVREFFAGDKDAFRAMVDEARAQDTPASPPEQPPAAAKEQGKGKVAADSIAPLQAAYDTAKPACICWSTPTTRTAGGCRSCAGPAKA